MDEWFVSRAGVLLFRIEKRSRSLPQAASTNVARACMSSFRAAWNNGSRRCQSSGVIFRFRSIIAGGKEPQGNEAAGVGIDCPVDHAHTTRSFQGCGSAKWSLKSFCHVLYGDRGKCYPTSTATSRFRPLE
jgi:hypothetical protein